MIHIGLTGSIGMGKSTVAQMFRDEGIPVSDADQMVHQLYAENESLKRALSDAFGDVLTEGMIDRAKLSAHLKENPEDFAKLDRIVHPFLADLRNNFIDTQRKSGAKLIASDIPLLFETGGEKRFDKVVVVSASPEIQAERVLSRPGMTPEKFAQILGRQTSDAEKRRRADFIIDTGQTMEATRQDVRALINRLIGE